MYLKTIIFTLVLTNLNAFQLPRPQAKSVKQYYECVDTKRSEVRVYGNEPQQCPDNTFCNERYLILPDEEIARPCIEVTALCPYECDDVITSVVNNVKLKCGKFTRCNKDKTSCETCLCDKSSFGCKDDKTALVADLELPCGSGKHCNKKYERPCTPCINDA